MRTYLLTLSLVFLPLSAAAEVSRSDNQLREFATCVGQLSAQMEYEWMFDGQGSEITKDRREAMIELVQAIMSPEDGRRVLNWRISAKQAHHSLLTRATFNDDPEDAAWAMQLAQSNAADCGGLLLS